MTLDPAPADRVRVSFLQRVAALVNPVPNAALVQRAAEDYTANVVPPSRDAGPVGAREAVTIPAVYRALQLLATSAAQLSIDVERQGRRLDGAQVSPLVRRPSLDMSRSDWIESVVMSMACNGNAFIYPQRVGDMITQLQVWHPAEVAVWRDRTGETRFTYRGKDYQRSEVAHLHLMRLPGAVRGVGPIQAAQATMRVTRDMRDYMGSCFDDSGQPTGTLTSDQVLTAEDARAYRNAWNGLDAEGNRITDTDNPSGIKVLGKGTTYEPILLSPRDALWLEAQSFSTTEVARLFGVPSSLMLAAIEGNSQTYSNVEQEWLAFTRFTLIGYLRKIEEALTDLTPLGQTVRFNLEALLRSDTTTRYQAHATALDAGFLTMDEVRAIENLPPLTDAQREEIAARPRAPKEVTA